MLSLMVCKRTITRNYITVRQRRAWLATVAATTTTTTTKANTQKPLVISRRAWNEFKESHKLSKSLAPGSSKSKPNDENPWPRNFQIAGYVAGTLLVPYMIIWTVTSNPILREWFGPYIPLDRLRTHFGELEWDAESYSDELEETKKTEKQMGLCDTDDSVSLSIEYYQFPQEAPFRERSQQEIINKMEESDVELTLSLSSSSSSSLLSTDEVVTKTVAASTIADAKNLLNFFPSASVSTTTNQMVAVEFMDEKIDINRNNTISNDGGNNKFELISDDGDLMTDAESMSNSNQLADLPTDRVQVIANETQTMSKWSYVAPQPSQAVQKEAAANVSQPTNVEMNIGRLEYTTSELEKNLKDPMCTRNIDDMQQELRQSKRELSKLKWKRRLGFFR
mmetsp:Transcript_23851/g.24121  ORF Transcript_23851/g.24121 Transcript_23851/m.24121 type:complete len:394 (+) Transcript_23851:72-1253(+)